MSEINSWRKHRLHLGVTLLLLVICMGLAAVGGTQRLTDDIATNPAQARFVYSDIDHFLDAARAIDSGLDPARTLKTLYFERASPGLLMFVEKYDLTVERLTAAMAEHPEAYARLEETLQALRAQEPRFRDVLAELESIIPNAVFPPTYFVVAGHRGIGSGSTEGPLISIEKKTPESIRDDLHATLLHEMVHMQQLAAIGEAYFEIFSGEKRTLLALSIREGAATFVAELITGGSKHKNMARDFLLSHEAEVWQRFQKEMLGNETGDWLWREPSDPDQPRDVGYAVGARIVQSYYESAADKNKAAQEIMAVTDYPTFLEKSGYAAKVGTTQ